MKKKLLLVGILFAMIMGAFGVYHYVTLPMVELPSQKAKIEINGELNALEYIKKVRQCEKEDISIDTSQVDVHQLGTYSIIYKVKDKEYKYNVEIVDTKDPIVETKNIDVDLGDEVKVEDVIQDIQDDTKVKSYWKEDYDFSTPGVKDVAVVVEDEAGNKTEKSVQVEVVKDEEKPTLTGLKDITVYKNNKVDYLAGIKAHDNRDKDPQITVNSQKVDTSKAGIYEVEYTVKDRAGNSNTYIQKVIVLEKKDVSTVKPNGQKIVYLTFDDGPSSNTKRVLDILDKYNAKATFFVTGNGQKYNSLIKEAYQKGHTIGLHTYCHDYKTVYASVDAYFDDLTKVGNMVKNEIGFVPKYIRFPGGSSNAVSKKYCVGIMSKLVSEVQNRGYQYYDWNVSSEDASGNNVAVSKIVKSSTSSTANNIMILMHDTKAKDTTVEALPQIIEHYQALGYTFKGIDDSSFTPHHGVNN